MSEHGSLETCQVLLIIPPGGYYAERWSKGSLMPPLGVGYVAASLEAAGIRTAILDAHVEGLSHKQIAERLRQAAPRIVGVTFTTETRFEGFAVLRLARKELPRALVVAGGPHVSLAAEDTLRHIPEVDAVVRGEGEQTAVELALHYLQGDGLEGVAGVSHRRNGQIIHEPDRPAIRELDSIPFPARHLYPPPERYNFRFEVPGRGLVRFSNLMTSRGCPFSCNFCASPIMWGRRCRMRSPENIIAEIEQLREQQHAEALWFFDDTFNTNPKRVERICALLIERGWRMPWFAEVRIDKLTRELLQIMKESGCYTIGFGVESGSQRVLDEVIGKRLNLERVHEVIAWCRELEIIPNPFFIFSHPTETWEEAQMTLQLIERYKDVARASMALLHIYPGTRLEKLARETGVLPPDFSWTHEHRKDVRTLPSAQGNVPLFLDRLTWDQISSLLFQWAEMQDYRLWSKIPKVLRSIRSWDDLKRYSVLGREFLKLKARRLARLARSRS
jgi:radical SAM superfamily enzyme YgiQ (UPF0313 family)